MMTALPSPRRLVLWVPDWPVTAFLRDAATTTPREGRPIAVFAANRVVACSAEARAQGVRRGQRRRDAQSRCPALVVVAADSARDARVFEPVIARIERLVPGVQLVRPGLCALRARGPARFYGGEVEAARAVLSALAADGVATARAGVADGLFAAELCARGSTSEAEPVGRVPPGGSAAFLAPLSIAALDAATGAAEASGRHGAPAGGELIDLLARLGVQTLGGFAAMPAERVRERFGARGARLHALAAGDDARPLPQRTPPPELHREIVFEPPLDLADQIAFAVRLTAEEFIAGLGAQALVCTELRVELVAERGERSERVWLHPGSFDAAAVVDRVRWQLASLRPPGEAAEGRDPDGVFVSGVTAVRIAPEAVDAASHHARGLFGPGPDERVHHALSRVQAMLGHRSVLTPAIGGGRWLAERQVLVPWGDRVVTTKDRARPWPGSLPDPLPATIYPEPRPVEVTDAVGEPVTVGEREGVSAPPAFLDDGGRRRRIEGWAGPWPVSERGWDELRSRRAHRFQAVDADGTAWLLLWELGQWRAEGRYD